MTDAEPMPREWLEVREPDRRWWWPFVTRSEYLRQTRALWRTHFEQVDTVSVGFEQMKEKIMATGAEYAARVDAATNELASDLKAVRDRLSAVEQASEADKQAAVDAALAELNGPIERLEALGREDDVPAEQPSEPAQELPVEPAADQALPVEQQPDDAA